MSPQHWSYQQFSAHEEPHGIRLSLRLLKGINVGYCRVPVGDWRMWINIVCLKGTKPSHRRRLLLLSREKRKSIRNRTSCPKVSYFLTINSLHMGNWLFSSISNYYPRVSCQPINIQYQKGMLFGPCLISERASFRNPTINKGETRPNPSARAIEIERICL